VVLGFLGVYKRRRRTKRESENPKRKVTKVKDDGCGKGPGGQNPKGAGVVMKMQS